MAEMAIILYLGFIIGLISNFEKLGERDVNKKNDAQIRKKTYFKLLINHQVDFKEN